MNWWTKQLTPREFLVTFLWIVGVVICSGAVFLFAVAHSQDKGPGANLIRLPLVSIEENRKAYWVAPEMVVGLIEGPEPSACSVEMESGSTWSVALSCPEIRKRLGTK